MKKIVVTLLIICMAILFIGCADDKIICGEKVETYGLLSFNDEKDWVDYEISISNVFWGMVLVETIIVPIWLFGFELYEPQKAVFPCDEIEDFR